MHASKLEVSRRTISKLARLGLELQIAYILIPISFKTRVGRTIMSNYLQ